MVAAKDESALIEVYDEILNQVSAFSKFSNKNFLFDLKNFIFFESLQKNSRNYF